MRDYTQIDPSRQEERQSDTPTPIENDLAEILDEMALVERNAERAEGN